MSKVNATRARNKASQDRFAKQGKPKANGNFTKDYKTQWSIPKGGRINGYSFDHPHVERMTAPMPIMGKRIFVPLGSRVSFSAVFFDSSRLKREG